MMRKTHQQSPRARGTCLSAAILLHRHSSRAAGGSIPPPSRISTPFLEITSCGARGMRRSGGRRAGSSNTAEARKKAEALAAEEELRARAHAKEQRQIEKAVVPRCFAAASASFFPPPPSLQQTPPPWQERRRNGGATSYASDRSSASARARAPSSKPCCAGCRRRSSTARLLVTTLPHSRVPWRLAERTHQCIRGWPRCVGVVREGTINSMHTINTRVRGWSRVFEPGHHLKNKQETYTNFFGYKTNLTKISK